MSEIIKNDDHILVRPNKDIVESMAGNFRSELQKVIADEKKDIIIDMDGIEMVDSIGITSIIATFNTLEKIEKKLKVINIMKDVYILFTAMKLDRCFVVESK
ncbi:MAG: STAS domain-containing protein [Desulforegulaceae bacterium]|nr:STAS domain-containing protein [Desulforegulaceae bacterium]